MIVPMKKYSFLVYHKEYEPFLERIQNLGVVHIIEKARGEIEDEELKEKHKLINDIGQAIAFLDKREIEEKWPDSKDKDPLTVFNELCNIQRAHEENKHLLEALNKEKSLLEPWGEFSWADLKKLEQAGYKPRLLLTNQKNFETAAWAEQYFVEEITHKDGQVYFVLFEPHDEEIEIDAEEANLPDKSLIEVNKLIKEAGDIIAKSEKMFDTFAAQYKDLLSQLKDKLQGELSFEMVKLNTQKEAEEKLMVLEGWVPADKVEAINKYVESTSVYYEVVSPVTEEKPPIKLKNNKFARLYESIGELYTFPNYNEIDLTPFFAPFYMLFFGFCLGDAGYGLLITIGTIFGMYKVDKKLKPVLKLGMFLGIATTIMGMISGTFFGIFLIDADWPWIQKYQRFMLGEDSLMYLALGLGYVQVVFGKFINAANRARMYGFKYALAQLGWNVIILVTLPFYALGNFGVIETGLANNIAIISAIVGGIPAFFFNTPGKNPLLNFGVGLWDSYQNASGLLGDILSYIRLFALGLSSAILANVFNTLAMDLSPDIIVVKQLVMVIILLIGHCLNFFMAALGSFVHPLRLTFVEFYKNAGFMGGGSKYEPFRK